MNLDEFLESSNATSIDLDAGSVSFGYSDDDDLISHKSNFSRVTYVSNKEHKFKTYHEISIDLFEYLKALQHSLNRLNSVYLRLDYDSDLTDDYVDTDGINFDFSKDEVNNILLEIEQINAEINSVNSLLALIRSRKFLTEYDYTNPY